MWIANSFWKLPRRSLPLLSQRFALQRFISFNLTDTVYPRLSLKPSFLFRFFLKVYWVTLSVAYTLPLEYFHLCYFSFPPNLWGKYSLFTAIHVDCYYNADQNYFLFLSIYFHFLHNLFSFWKSSFPIPVRIRMSS